MRLKTQVPLAELTTFKIGGPARILAECETLDDITAAFRHAQEGGCAVYPLGEGSNVLASDAPIEKLILRVSDASCVFEDADESHVRVTVGAGMHWDDLVDAACARGLWGFENLAGIPGSVGAAPVQNIGAYGREVEDTLEWVDAYDPDADAVVRFENADCGFGYRESRFKQEPRLLILRAAFVLARTPDPRIDYPDLQRLAAAGRVLETPTQIAEAVREIRSYKFPDLTEWGTAGSFFKNPIIDAETAARLAEQFPELPQFPVPDGVKIPLAWLLDHALGLRGFAQGPVHLFERQPLVVVAAAGAHATDVDALAATVTEKVFAVARVMIEREVRTLS